MKLTILGSGSSQVSVSRTSPANFIQIKNKKILIDCGSGTLFRLNQAKINLKDIDIIFISHFHIDHISDLSALLWALKWPHLKRKKELVIIGPKGFNKYYNHYIKPIVFNKEFKQFNIKIYEITNKIIFDNFEVQACSTKHTNESVAYKFIERNKSLVISGDTNYNKSFINFSKNSDILLLECSYLNKKVFGHLIAKECGQTAKETNVKKLILTHLYPPVSDDKKKLIQAKKIFKNTILAEDLMEIEI